MRWVVVFVVAFFLMGCAQEEITAAVVDEVSTLSVTVKASDGTYVADASVFVNGEYRGKTPRYGANKGTKTILLRDEVNLVSVTKPGFVSPKPVQVPGRGAQKVTFILQEGVTDYKVTVKERGERLEGAKVSLSRDGALVVSKETGPRGSVLFGDLEDGRYDILVQKEGYEEEELEKIIENGKDGDTVTSTVSLTKPGELIIEVVSEERDLLNDVEVSLYKADDYKKPRSKIVESGFTNSDGNVKFYKVEFDTEYTVVLKKGGFEPRVYSDRLEENIWTIEMEKDE